MTTEKYKSELNDIPASELERGASADLRSLEEEMADRLLPRTDAAFTAHSGETASIPVDNSAPDAGARALAMKVSKDSIAVNAALSAGKLAAGIIAPSAAMVSDAIHSASDVFSTIIVMIGVNIASKASDKEHQYGHERIECVAAIVLSVVLLATGLFVGYGGVKTIIAGDYSALQIPGRLALIAAVISIAVKEWMYWFTRAAAKRIRSDALMADAWHHRSDALSSIGSFVGILGARMGYPVLDSVASLVICVFIVKVAVDIFRDAINKMVDRSCDDETVSLMEEIITKQEGVISLDFIQTRLFGSRIYVDIEISADGAITLSDAHVIAERVHDAIEREFADVKHCMVHVNPAASQASRGREHSLKS